MLILSLLHVKWTFGVGRHKEPPLLDVSAGHFLTKAKLGIVNMVGKYLS